MRAGLKHLFRTPPARLYTNWAADYQVQVDVAALDQSYSAGAAAWATDYLRHYVTSARIWLGKAEAKHIAPFFKYLETV